MSKYKYCDEKWDKRYLKIAQEVSTWSKDPSSPVGVCIVNTLGQIVATGYNGFPRGINDSEERYKDKNTKLQFIVHADANACIQAGEKARDSTLYLFGFPAPCADCTKIIIQSGIKRIVSVIRPSDKNRLERWKESLEISDIMCNEAGIIIDQYEIDEDGLT